MQTRAWLLLFFLKRSQRMRKSSSRATWIPHGELKHKIHESEPQSAHTQVSRATQATCAAAFVHSARGRPTTTHRPYNAERARRSPSKFETLTQNFGGKLKLGEHCNLGQSW